jgi:enoyl-CoA hydratase/carnithine racemase
MTKQLLAQNAAEGDLALLHARESALLRICWTTPEHKEAVAAFIEKRPPRFR